MINRKSTYRHTFRFSLSLVLAVLVGFGVMVPQVAAYFGCYHACCTIQAGSHVPHETIRISGPAQPSCCAQQSNDTCSLCDFEKPPQVDLALPTVQSQDNPTTESFSAMVRNLLSISDPRDMGWSVSAAEAERGSPPLYIQTLTLLI